MQELKLSQTLDGANMSPYHTTGEFATSLVLLRSRAESEMYICFAEHKIFIEPLSDNARVQLIYVSSVYYQRRLLTARLSAVSPALFVKILLLSTCVSYVNESKIHTRLQSSISKKQQYSIIFS